MTVGYSECNKGARSSMISVLARGASCSVELCV
jgi:hypothetical protein